MTKFIIRNDDVSYETSVTELQKFCEICDRYGYPIIQAITPIGLGGRYARASMDNDAIKIGSFKRFEENTELVQFLLARKDLIAVHGLWHTHSPTLEEIQRGKELLSELGFNPTYFVPPFNEGDYPLEIVGLTTSQLDMTKGERLEDFLEKGEPKVGVMYLHSWRFTGRPHTFEQLEACLARLSTSKGHEIKKLIDKPASPPRLWYNQWVLENAKGNVLDVGKSVYWDYGFPTIDTNPKRRPTYLGSIEQTNFANETFDTVLCNGMYEFVENPQKMIDEVLRITKKGGIVIFGFVGPDYKPYKNPWRFFEGKESLPPHTRVDFESEYFYIICQKQ